MNRGILLSIAILIAGSIGFAGAVLSTAPAAEEQAQVIASVPVEGSEPVDPRMPEMRFTFSRSMDVSRIGLGAENGAVFPEIGEAPHFLDDGRTFVVSVFLQPQTRYVMVLKGGGEAGFSDLAGQPAETFRLAFETGPEPADAGPLPEGAAGAAVDLDPGNDAGDEGEATSQ
ncbi:MAG: hypothetical protein R3D33_17695 [Hyphomicrobiaceae bacterium]